MTIYHGSLFSGGGGFDLAAEVIGWNNVFHCEIDPFCNRVLDYYWPDAKSIENIQEFNAKQFKGKIDVLTGGFPCQPFSTAGKRKGTGDNRYLWPDMLRVIQEIQPTWVVAENVYGIINWNDGLVFKQVHTDLEAIGFEVQAFVLPACGVDAPHRRYRVWFVAYSHRNGRIRRNSTDEKQPNKAGQHAQRHTEQVGSDASYAHRAGLEGRAQAGNITKGRKNTFKHFARLCRRCYWTAWPTQPAICGGDDGLPAQLDGITLSKWKRETIKMYGNAVLPQVALQVFKAIERASRNSPAVVEDTNNRE